MLRRFTTLLLAAFLLASCKADGRTGMRTSEAAPGAAAPVTTMPKDGSRTKEQIAKLMSNPVIDVQPSSSSMQLVLRFRFRDPTDVGVEIPLIGSVAMSKVGDQGNGCQIKSGDFIRLPEWKYGEVPAGFGKISDCFPLSPGEYEVYVTGLGGRGTGRMRIDSNGMVTRLPWYGEEAPAEPRH